MDFGNVLQIQLSDAISFGGFLNPNLPLRIKCVYVFSHLFRKIVSVELGTKSRCHKKTSFCFQKGNGWGQGAKESNQISIFILVSSVKPV